MTVRTRWLLTTTVIVVIAGMAALLPLAAGSPEREVVVVARQMAFYVGDAATANPTIRVAPGERIRLTFVTSDPGFDHDFAVSDWNVRTPVLHGNGRTSIVVHVPNRPGRTTYVCTLHASMMRGVIEVAAPDAPLAPR
jgi:plastocyanin